MGCDGHYFSRNGKYRVVAINEDDARESNYDGVTGKPIALPKTSRRRHHRDQHLAGEKLMAFYLNGDRSPSNLHVYDFATKKVTR